MDGILALGHFCEVHGPCVILATQRYHGNTITTVPPHSLTVPQCAACKSLPLDCALMSTGTDSAQYVTTRVPLAQDVAFLLKQATVRSLSCEYDGASAGISSTTTNVNSLSNELGGDSVNVLNGTANSSMNNGSVSTSANSGAVYFGDSERGHVLSYSFTVADSLARGFHRKYAILALMRDKIQLLNAWPTLIPNIKSIAHDLQRQSTAINTAEQAEKSQRALREEQQTQQSRGTRSLSQLTAQPGVYGHLHLWFAWLLGCPVAVERELDLTSARLPDIRPSSELRMLLQEMGAEMFRKIAYHTIIGTNITITNPRVQTAFRSLLPSSSWSPLTPTSVITVTSDNHFSRDNNTWSINTNLSSTNISLPDRLPSLLISIERTLNDIRVPESVLELQLSTQVTHWLHKAKTIGLVLKRTIDGVSGKTEGLMKAFQVGECDEVMLRYWCKRVVD